MERWKRNVFLLFMLFAFVYGVYLLWLYRVSGNSMAVSYEMPEWAFPSLAGAIVFAVSFAGGFVWIALTNPDLSRERAGTAQLFLISLLLGVLSTVLAFWMTGFLSAPLALAVLVAVLAPILFAARKKHRALTPGVPITDEREELIELKGRARAGDVLLTVLAFGYLALSFGWKIQVDARTMFLTLITLYVVTWLIAGFHYRRVM